MPERGHPSATSLACAKHQKVKPWLRQYGRCRGWPCDFLDFYAFLHDVNNSANEHAAVLRALRVGFDDPDGFAFAWMALLVFLRLSTRRGTFPRPLSVEEALRVIERWLVHPHAQLVHPDERHADAEDCSGPPYCRQFDNGRASFGYRK